MLINPNKRFDSILVPYYDEANQDITTDCSAEDDILSTFESIFIVMTYHHVDLRHVMKAVRYETRITEQHILPIMYNLLSAVNYLHRLGIMHRDLKPANILVDKNCAITLCDFGLSRRKSPHSKDTRYAHARWHCYMERQPQEK